MLVEFTVQNFASFNTPQTLSMLASRTAKENFNEENTFAVNKFGVDNLLKSAAVFGANAGGKSNFIRSFRAFKSIVLESLATADHVDSITPFLIKKDIYDKPSEFEVVFFYEGNLYRYGISIIKGVIDEEWLYWTKTSDEILLFQRVGQKIKRNQRFFSEAKNFIRKENGEFYLEKTRENVPFISVLSQFNGEKSRKVVDWFKKLHIESESQENGDENSTIGLFDKNQEFKSWALDVLSSLQIQDIKITKIDSEPHVTLHNGVPVFRTYNRKEKVEIVKKTEGNDIESAGTKKLIHLLGPVFDVINNGKILVIDEFDNKFHSLLSKFILALYHKKNNSNSQLIITCHDTNLLTKELLRRDQIWFVEKNAKHESELYSLLEYKEHYLREDDSYSKDYIISKKTTDNNHESNPHIPQRGPEQRQIRQT